MSDQAHSLPGAPDAESGSHDDTDTIRFSWPPPGLETLQGLFWQTTGYLGLGSLILVLPLLLAVARYQPFYSLGPFGDAWWVPTFTSLFGLFVILVAYGHLFRFFRVGWKAVRHGITMGTLLRVGADRGRDMGFLLQGARSYQGLSDEAIHRVAGARVVGGLLSLGAGFWSAPAFLLGVVLGARGLLGPTALTFLTLGPMAALLFGALFAKALENTELRKVQGGRTPDSWSVEEVRESARTWAATAQGGETPTPDPRRLMLGGALVILVGVFLILPTASLTLTNSVGPLLAMVATPNFGNTQKRVALAEVYRPLQLPADSAITPLEAGEALHSLTSVQGGGDDEFMKPPVRSYEWPVIPEAAEEVLGLQPQEWAEQLFQKVAGGLAPQEAELLRTTAEHPVLREFTVLARAPSADMVQARYRLPFPEGFSFVSLPIPRVSQVRIAGFAMVGKAAHELAQGDEDAAEETLRELISAGFLLGHEGITIIDNLIGIVLVRTGGQAMESLYAVTGRSEEATALAQTRATAERAVDRALSDQGVEAVEAALARMPRTVRSEEVIRGLRWEYFLLLNGLTPCLNAQRVVFGPDQDFQDFLAQSRDALVRYPSEAAYFDLMRNGWFGYVPEDAPGRLIGKLVGATLGGRGDPGSCTDLLASIQW